MNNEKSSSLKVELLYEILDFMMKLSVIILE